MAGPIPLPTQRIAIVRPLPITRARRASVSARVPITATAPVDAELFKRLKQRMSRPPSGNKTDVIAEYMNMYGGFYLIVVKLPGPKRSKLQGNNAYPVYIGKAGGVKRIKKTKGMANSSLGFRLQQEKTGMWNTVHNLILKKFTNGSVALRSAVYNSNIFQAVLPYMKPISWKHMIVNAEPGSLDLKRQMPAWCQPSHQSFSIPWKSFAVRGSLSLYGDELELAEKRDIAEVMIHQTIDGRSLSEVTGGYIPRDAKIFIANDTSLPNGYHGMSPEFLGSVMNLERHEMNLLSQEDINSYNRPEVANFEEMRERALPRLQGNT